MSNLDEDEIEIALSMLDKIKNKIKRGSSLDLTEILDFTTFTGIDYKTKTMLTNIIRLSYEERELLYDEKYINEGKINDVCVYCGEPSKVWDHIPPLIVLENVRFEGKCIKVRSCEKCNNILKDLRILTIIGRKEYLREIYSKQQMKLERKLKYLNRLNDWWK